MLIHCEEATATYFYSMRAKEVSGVSISVTFASSTPSSKHIEARDGHKRYGMFEPGGSCFMHKDRTTTNSHPLFILVMKKGDYHSNNCQVVRVITNLGLEACSGTTKDLFEVVGLQKTNGQKGDYLAFRRLKPDLSYFFEPYRAVVASISNFALTDIDERVVEMLVLQPFVHVNLEPPEPTFSYGQFNRINSNLGKNPFSSKINPGKWIFRMVQDDLPGYHLKANNVEAGQNENFLQTVSSSPKDIFHSYHLVVYIQKPGLMSVGDTAEIEFSMSPARFRSLETLSTIKQRTFTVLVTRAPESLIFRVRRGALNSNYLNFPYAGEADYIYFSFTFGGGMLYYTAPYTGRAKFYQTLLAAKKGMKPLSNSIKFEEDVELKELIGYREEMSHFIWSKVEFKVSDSFPSNKAGFRVNTAQVGQGAYPSLLISSSDTSKKYDRCFFSGYSDDVCLSMILLAGPQETQTDQYLAGLSKAHFTNPGEMRDICKVAYNANRCLIVKPGYISNIDFFTPNPLEPGRFSLSEYDRLDPRLKDSIHEFISNTGTRFFVPCPSSCKNNFFSKFFNLIEN